MKNHSFGILFYLLLTLLPLQANSHNPTFEFVRIDGITEQTIGEKLLYEIYKRAGISINIVALSAHEALLQASQGKKDGEVLRIFDYGKKYPMLLRVPTPILLLETQAFALKENNVHIKNKEDLSKYKLVIVKGVQHTQNITKDLKNVQKVKKASSLMQYIKSKKADVALTNKLNGIVLLKKAGSKNIIAVGQPLKELKLYHYIHKSHKEIIPKIDAIILQMVRSGELIKLKEKFIIEHMKTLYQK